MSTMKNFNGIIAGVIGGVIFLTFLIALSLPLVVSLVAGAVGFGVSLLFFRPGAAKVNQSLGDNSVLVREMIANGSTQQAEMTKLARSLPVGNPRTKLETLANLTGKIVDDVRKDNSDYKAAGRFLDYYADTAIRIVSIYRDLAGHGIDSPELRQMSAKVEHNLDILIDAFKRHLTQLQENNFMDLDAEMSVLQSTLKMEGMDVDVKPNQVERPWDKGDGSSAGKASSQT